MYYRPLTLILILTFVSVILACDNAQQDIDALQNEVLNIHDAVMPKTDLIHELEEKLAAEIERVNKDSLQVNEEKLKTLILLKTQLSEADERMMQWMRAYTDSLTVEMPSAQRLSYLVKEKDNITEVQNKMEESISRAQEFLRDN